MAILAPSPPGSVDTCAARFLRAVLSWDYYQLLRAAEDESSDSRKREREQKKAQEVEARKRQKTTKEAVVTETDENVDILGDDDMQPTEQKAAESAKEGREKVPGLEELPLRKVPTIFSSAREYVDVFEPLILEECRAQIVRGQDETEPRVCHFLSPSKCETAHGFSFLTATAREGEEEEGVVRDFNENDLVLVAREEITVDGPLPSTYALANVESRDTKTSLRLRLSLLGDNEGEEATTPSAGQSSSAAVQSSSAGMSSSSACQCLLDPAKAARMKAFLTSAAASAKGKCWILKLCNLSTITREFMALHSAPSLPYVEALLTARIGGEPVSLGHSDGVPPEEETRQRVRGKLMSALKDSHNESQMKAIQGPPGTGKTQAILGLLSAVLHGRLPHEIHLGQVRHAGTSLVQRVKHRLLASPWLRGVNPRDAIQPCPCDPAEAYGGTQNVISLGGKARHRAHILVCAPSNSALDEIVLRLLLSGLRDESGSSYSPSLVRVGLNAHHSVDSVCMDTLVAQRLSSMERSAASVGARSSGGSAGMERDRIRVNILDSAAIVFSTLAYAGSGVFARMSRPFDVVIIDEAAQAVEPSTLIPLSHGCSQVFLIGDPLQLPATVLSTKAVDHGYSRSMFGRLQAAGYPVVMLTTQYRMHPKIRFFPSSEFYRNQLQDSEDVLQQTTRPWHNEVVFGPFFFFDLPQAKEEQAGGGSWRNPDEAEFVLILYRHLATLYPQIKESSDLGIISPYKAQVKLLRARFQELLQEDAHKVDVNTVDGFQGREKDIIIFSCVRSLKGNKKKRKKWSIGFLADPRRMNVGITRARSSMLVVGCGEALRCNKRWSHLLDHAQATKRYAKISRPFHKVFSGEELDRLKAECLEYDKAQAQSEEKEDKGVEATLLGDTHEEAKTGLDTGNAIDEEEEKEDGNESFDGGDFDDDPDSVQDWS